MSGQSFDPYHTWLGIHPAEQPADFYRLLGLCRYESDVGVIAAAYEQRAAYLASFRESQYEAVARQVAEELGSARTALLSPVMKASYDAALSAGQPTYAPPEQVPPPDTWQSNAPTSAAFDGSIRPYSAPRLSSRRTSPQVMVYGHMIASAIGLLLGWLVLCGLKPEWDTLGLFHGKPIEPNAPKRSAPKQEPKVAPKTRKPLRQFPPVREPDRGPNEQPNGPNQGAPDQPEAPVQPIFAVQERVELPPRGNGQATQLARVLAVGDLTIQLHNPRGNPFAFQIVENEAAQNTWTITSGEWIVATVKHDDEGHVTLSWGPNVPPDGECLRNTVLSLRAGDKKGRVALRAVHGSNPVVLDLGEEMTKLAFEDLPLWQLDPSQLQFELLGVDVPGEPEKPSVSVARFEPTTRTCAADTPIHAVMRNDPYAALDVVLSTVGDRFSVKVLPFMGGIAKETSPWTTKRVEQLLKTATGKRLADLKQLAELGDRLDKKALIRYRVFYRAGGLEIDLVRGDGSQRLPPPANEPAEPQEFDPDATPPDLPARSKHRWSRTKWPRSEPPPAGRFGNITLPSGEIFRDSDVLCSKQQLDDLFPAAQLGARGPVYVEHYPNKTLALALSLSEKKPRLEGPAVSLLENGLPRTIAFYRDNDLVGPLRVYDESGTVVLFAEFRNGRPDGFRAYFVNGWPVLIQQWRKAVLVSQSLVVGSTGIDAATSPAEVGLLQSLATADLEDFYGRVMEGEDRVRRGVTDWYREQIGKQRKELARLNGIASTANQLQLIAANDAAQMASLQREWQAVATQAAAAMQTLRAHPAGLLPSEK